MAYFDELTDFVKKEILHGRNVDLEAEDDLFSTGIIDSLGILRIVAFMEEDLGVKVNDEDVVFENFKNISAMAAYLDKRAEKVN